jgi:hypothetical protein
VLVGGPGRPAATVGHLARWARVAAAGLALGLAALSIALWVDPTGGAGVLPFTPAPLSGRVLGGWSALLAVLAGHLALRADGATGRLPGLALAAFPSAALLATARTSGDLDAGRGAYVAGLVAWLLVGAALALHPGRPARRSG